MTAPSELTRALERLAVVVDEISRRCLVAEAQVAVALEYIDEREDCDEPEPGHPQPNAWMSMHLAMDAAAEKARRA